MKKIKIVKGKLAWTKVSEDFIRKNYKTMTAAQMAEALGVKTQTLRMKMYSLGLYKQTNNYWTAEETQILLDNYQSMGDTEIAKLLNRPLKQVEKKRNYLALKRTKDQLNKIFARNVANGKYQTEKSIAARTSKENIEKRKQAMRTLWQREKRREQALLPLQTGLLTRKSNIKPVIVTIAGVSTHYNSIGEAARALNMNPANIHYYIENEKTKKIKIRYAETQTVKTRKVRTYISETEFNYA